MNSGFAVPFRSAHLVGVGGAGMSGLARLLAGSGARVCGSDQADAPILASLRAAGIEVAVGHRAGNLGPDLWKERPEVLIRSAAVPDGNPELEAARAAGVPVLKYAEAVGRITTCRRTLAIAGTHGKTTTSGMAAHLLRDAGAGFLIGGELPGRGGSDWGTTETFVVEACEYDRSFLGYSPLASAITNVEADHLDYFRDLDEIREVFCAFAARTSRLLVVSERDPIRSALGRHSQAEVQTVGFEHALGQAAPDWEAASIRLEGTGSRYVLVRRGQPLAEVVLIVPGLHNVMNSLMAIALAAGGAGLDPAEAAARLADFPGVGRRFQVRLGGAGLPGPVVVDDYAHHPSEIAAVVAAARAAFPGRPLRVLFQPHQEKRVVILAEDFAKALAAADESVVAPVYSAREGCSDGRAVNALVRRVRQLGAQAHRAANLDLAYRRALAWGRDDTVILVLGAGDVWRVADRLVASLEAGALRRSA